MIKNILFVFGIKTIDDEYTGGVRTMAHSNIVDKIEASNTLNTRLISLKDENNTDVKD